MLLACKLILWAAVLRLIEARLPLALHPSANDSTSSGPPALAGVNLLQQVDPTPDSRPDAPGWRRLLVHTTHMAPSATPHREKAPRAGALTGSGAMHMANMSAAAGNLCRHVPALLGIGCHKCGTTTLARALQPLPWALLAADKTHTALKEVRFFTKPTLGTYAEYRKFWPSPLPTEGRCTFEVSPRYMVHAEMPWRLRKLVPHWASLPLMLLLRDPLERAVSHFFNQFSRPGPLFHSVLDLDRVLQEEIRLWHDCPRAPVMETGACNISAWHNTHMKASRCRNEAIARQAAKLVAGTERDQYQEWMAHDVLFHGAYVIHLHNFLCAGFQPHQFLLFFTHELTNQTAILNTIANALGQVSANPEALGQRLEERPLHLSHAKRNDHQQLSNSTRMALKALYRPFTRALWHMMTRVFGMTDQFRFQREMNSTL